MFWFIKFILFKEKSNAVTKWERHFFSVRLVTKIKYCNVKNNPPQKQPVVFAHTSGLWPHRTKHLLSTWSRQVVAEDRTVDVNPAPIPSFPIIYYCCVVKCANHPLCVCVCFFSILDRELKKGNNENQIARSCVLLLTKYGAQVSHEELHKIENEQKSAPRTIITTTTTIDLDILTPFEKWYLWFICLRLPALHDYARAVEILSLKYCWPSTSFFWYSYR